MAKERECHCFNGTVKNNHGRDYENRYYCGGIEFESLSDWHHWCLVDRTNGKCRNAEKGNSLNELLKWNSLSQDLFEEDNDKVLFYTGLPYWTLVLCIFNFGKDVLQLSPFQKFLMTIIGLRLNLSGRDLGCRLEESVTWLCHAHFFTWLMYCTND